MFPKSPLEPVRSPVVPVIWDRVRNQKLGQAMGTEGARPGGGGGRPGPIIEGSKTSWIERTTKQGTWHSAESPSGLRVSFEGNKGSGNADVVFYNKGDVSLSTAGGYGSTRNALHKFGEVFQIMREYMAKYQPKSFSFVAGTPAHQPLYDRLVPLMAKQLGGQAAPIGKSGMYKIIFPE